MCCGSMTACCCRLKEDHLSKLKSLQVANGQLMEELAGKNATCSQLNHAQEQLTKALAR